MGGGPAGTAAAIAAARNGVNTLLVEAQSSLGGNATNGLANGIAGEIQGICKEFVDRMDSEGALFSRPHLPAFDPEKAKFVLEQMVLESGAGILYQTYAIDATVENNVINNVIFHSKSGRLAIEAKIVIDTTGDADVAAYAGVPYEVGSKEFGGFNMSTTLIFRLANVNKRKHDEAQKEYFANIKERVPTKSLYVELMEKAVQNGDLPSFIFPSAVIYPIPGTPEEDCDVTVNTAHSFYCRNLDVEDLTRKLMEQRRQIMLLIKFFRKYVPGFENCRLTGIANLFGARDSRRVIGEYILKAEDVVLAKKFEDGIARFPEFIDTHHPTNAKIGFIRHIHLREPKELAICRPATCSAEMHPFVIKGGYEARCKPGEYCEIPYRCLVPLKIDNLLVAGRCVSAEFDALAAVRVIASCMSTGQAAGAAAALCIKNGVTTRKLDAKLLRKTLIEQGVPLDREPDSYWSSVKQLKGEYVVGLGDFVSILTRKGLQMLGPP